MNRLNVSLVIVLLAVTTLAGRARVDGQTAELEPSQLRVVWTVEPASQATISWTTEAAGQDHVVHYDVQARDGVVSAYAFTTTDVVSGELQTNGPYFHHARLTDLPADTPVYFSVATDGNLSPELHFRSAPDNDQTIKLLYGGDSRTGRDDRQQINRLIARLHTEDPEIVALVHGGDYIAFANSWFQWSAWLDDHELTIGADGRVLPIIPAKGNHEGRGVVYNRVFGEPSGDPERNWFFTRFGQLALINLDTEASLAGEQRDWLADRLAEGRDARWLLVNYHRPAFPAVKSPSGAREHWVPLFEEAGVDLVCESDGHTLKRTPPIRNEAVDFTGVTYIGEGGLGVPQRTPQLDRWYLQSPGMATSAHHIQKIELTEDLLRYQALLLDGTVADEITILPHEQRLAHRITARVARAPTPTHIVLELTRPFDPVTAVEGDWILEPDVPVTRVELGDQVTAVLELANTATQEELDVTVGLDARAAHYIIQFRAGEDGVIDTDDDLTIETWAELDAISFVGNSALAEMTAYALADRGNESNVLTLRVDELEADQMYRLHVPAIEDRDGVAVEDGTTIAVTYSEPDDRADAIAMDNREPPPETAGCSTTAPARGTGLGWLFFIAGLWSVRRCRKRHSISSASPKNTAGSRSPR